MGRERKRMKEEGEIYVRKSRIAGESFTLSINTAAFQMSGLELFHFD